MFDGLQTHFSSFTDYRWVENPWGWKAADGTPIAVDLGRWGLTVMKDFLREHDDGSGALRKMLEIQMTITLENQRASRKNKLDDNQIIARTVKEYGASLPTRFDDDLDKFKPGIAKLVRGWRGITKNGVPVVCSEANVLELMGPQKDSSGRELCISGEPFKGDLFGDGIAKWLREESMDVQAYFTDFTESASNVLSDTPAGLAAAG